MREIINEEVSVVSYYSAQKKQNLPYRLYWQHKDYLLAPVSYHHAYMEGRHKQYIFEMVDKRQSLWFRLRLDSSNLHWTLEVIHDGLAT